MLTHSGAVVDIIRKLYGVEDEARDKKLSYDEITALRQEKSKPVLDKLKDLLEKRRPGIAPQSHTGKAITYVLNRWDSLNVYLYDGRISIDNNLTENAIRPFTLGRNYVLQFYLFYSKSTIYFVIQHITSFST